MQKLSEELDRKEHQYVVILTTSEWETLKTRIASYEREIEGEKDMQRRMGIEITKLRNAIEDTLASRGTGWPSILRQALKIKR